MPDTFPKTPTLVPLVKLEITASFGLAISGPSPEGDTYVYRLPDLRVCVQLFFLIGPLDPKITISIVLEKDGGSSDGQTHWCPNGHTADLVPTEFRFLRRHADCKITKASTKGYKHMGCWNISIQGIGSHHNTNNPSDADKLAESFVSNLRASGHTIEAASFTYGGKTDLLPPQSRKFYFEEPLREVSQVHETIGDSLKKG